MLNISVKKRDSENFIERAARRDVRRVSLSIPFLIQALILVVSGYGKG